MDAQRIKYPRTPHLPWSGSKDSDDLTLADISRWQNVAYVVTEKLDGGGVTLYRDFLHARSLNAVAGEDYARVRQIHAAVQWEIPEGWRVCGENVAATHSIRYTHLESYFYIFSIWNERNICLSWDETLLWRDLLGLTTVPEIYRGSFSESAVQQAFLKYSETRPDEVEGYVCRPVRAFEYAEFADVCAKFVRQNHAKTDNSWRTQERVWNELSLETPENAMRHSSTKTETSSD